MLCSLRYFYATKNLIKKVFFHQTLRYGTTWFSRHQPSGIMSQQINYTQKIPPNDFINDVFLAKTGQMVPLGCNVSILINDTKFHQSIFWNLLNRAKHGEKANHVHMSTSVSKNLPNLAAFIYRWYCFFSWQSSHVIVKFAILVRYLLATFQTWCGY